MYPKSLSALVLAVLIAAWATVAAPAQSPALTVYAAASLRETFTAIGAEFKKTTGSDVTFNFAGSDALATQIAQGAPADVFASANLTQMDRVRDAGHLAGPATIFARNRLTLIVPASNPAKIAGAPALGNPGVKIVLGAPTVPIGKYSREVIAAMAADPAFGANFADRVEKNVVSNELDVKAVAAKVALGEADAGLVYETDVTPDVAARVRTVEVPAKFQKPVLYPAAVLKGDHQDVAAKFVTFLTSPIAQAILRKAGFLPPPAP